jgi:hypothetical protein
MSLILAKKNKPNRIEVKVKPAGSDSGGLLAVLVD